MPTEEQVAALAQRTEDDAFAERLHDDPIATLRQEGYDDFASDVELELTRIDGLLRQILGDDEFRQLVEEKPTATLSEWGLAEDAVEPVLAILGAPDDVVDRAGRDVELHGRRTQVSTAAAAAVLGALAFAQAATAASPEGYRYGGQQPQAGSGIEAQPEFIRVKAELQAVHWGQPNPSAVRYGGLRPMFVRGGR
jgi:hypothetical protein